MFTVRRLDEWQRGLMEASNGGVNRLKDRVLRTSAMRLTEYLDDLTPARTGRLKGSMTMGDRDNIFRVEIGKKSHFFVGTAVKYAQAVNDGFTQKAGRFVPGYWSGDTFVYDPNHDGGMVLTGKVIPGAHMFEKAMDYLQDDVETIVEFEFRRLYSELFG